jgi:integrase
MLQLQQEHQRGARTRHSLAGWLSEYHRQRVRREYAASSARQLIVWGVRPVELFRRKPMPKIPFAFHRAEFYGILRLLRDFSLRGLLMGGR